MIGRLKDRTRNGSGHVLRPRRPPLLILVLLSLGVALAVPAIAQKAEGAAKSGFIRAAPSEDGGGKAVQAPAIPSHATASSDADPSRALRGQDFYDRSNPDLRILQRPEDGLAGLPRDRWNLIDWMDALRSGRITPRASLDGKTGPEILDLDSIMRNTKEMPFVRFPHRSHTLWLSCDNCHPAIFAATGGANQITMADIFRGRYCGVCHDRVAFITYLSCDRCHSMPQGKRPGAAE